MATTLMAVALATMAMSFDFEAPSTKPTCCAKHAYCCSIQQSCCRRADSAMADEAAELAAGVSKPVCCIKHAYCCSTHQPCCRRAETTGHPQPAAGVALTDDSAAGRPTCCQKQAYCCSIGRPCCRGRLTV